MNYQIADFIIRIKNAALAKRKQVLLPYSKLNKEVGKVLVKKGFLEEIKESITDDKKTLTAIVKYYKRVPILTNVEIISKPSLRVYGTVKDVLEIEKRGKKTVIISTSKGVMTGNEAKKKGIGGEIIFAIW
ncbi:MAG TPA: 30S ribosomal protein S8 [Patescibacteria group bacterium]|nr:30S ribosomal protein S8 [Patescibacteria group bacterium]